MSVAELREDLEEIQDLAADDPEAAALVDEIIAAYDDGFDDERLGAGISELDRYCTSRGS